MFMFLILTLARKVIKKDILCKALGALIILEINVFDLEYLWIYSGIRIKSTPRDRKNLLTLSKIDFFPISGEETQVVLKIGFALGASPLVVKMC